MAANLFGRYVWLMDILRRYKRLTFQEINELWQESGFFRSFVGWPFSNIKLSTSSFSFKRLKINSFVI